MKVLHFLLSAAVLAVAACNPVDKAPVEYEGLDHIEVAESDKVFPNPERGFYSVKSFHSASAAKMTAKSVEVARTMNKTIYYHGYYPKDYMNGHIGEEFLEMMRYNMQVLRENGAKCVLRIAYSDSEAERPWDPTLDVVLTHIEDIKPVLQEYADVILTFQAGFVGVWGEWYYTENFVSNPKTPEDHTLRKQVTDAMLAALPVERTI